MIYFDLSNTAFLLSLISTIGSMILILIMIYFNEYERRIRIRDNTLNENMTHYIHSSYRLLTYTLLFLEIFVFGSFFTNFLNETAFYFLEYLFVISIIGADLSFLYYVLTFSFHIPKKLESSIKWFFTTTAAIVIILYGKNTPVFYQLNIEGFVSYEMQEWYLNLLLLWVLADVGTVILLLISLVIWARKQLSLFEKIRLLSMAFGFGLATFIGFVVSNYVTDIFTALSYTNIGNAIATLIFSSGPLINFVNNLFRKK